MPRQAWWAAAKGTVAQLGADNISIIAAGVAFYGLLALFPAIAAAVSLFGLIADPAMLRSQAAAVSDMIPQQAWQIISGQLSAIAAQPSGGLGLAALVGILLAVWSAKRGMQAMVTALNIAYGEPERRGFVWLNLFVLGLTFGAILLVPLAIATMVAIPAAIGLVGLSRELQIVVAAVPWVVLTILVASALAVLYRHGPCRARPRWRWVAPGAVLATLLWLTASALFSFYVASFGSYNETYGSLGAVVILLMWLYISAFVVLLGAELNSELEALTPYDTSV